MWILRISQDKCASQAITILIPKVTVVPVCTLNHHDVVNLHLEMQQCTCNVPSGSEH